MTFTNDQIHGPVKIGEFGIYTCTRCGQNINRLTCIEKFTNNDEDNMTPDGNYFDNDIFDYPWELF